MNNFESIIKLSKIQLSKKIVFAGAEDELILKSIHQAIEYNLIVLPVLIGNKDKIISILKKNNFNKKLFRIINISNPIEICTNSIELIIQKEADIIIKGTIDSTLLFKEFTKQTKELLPQSNVFFSYNLILKIPHIDHFLIISHSATNNSPSFEEISYIIEKTNIIAHQLEISKPTITILTIKEKLGENIYLNEIQDINQHHYTINEPLIIDDIESINWSFLKDIKLYSDILILSNHISTNIFSKLILQSSKLKIIEFYLGNSTPIIIPSYFNIKKNLFDSIAFTTILN